MLLTMTILLVTELYGQTSHKSGFYNVDSVYFTVNWVAGANQQLMVSWNRFSDDSYQPYSGGMWLKKRIEPNTWEDVIYARNPCNYPFNDTLKGGDRDKVNIVRVLTFDTVQQKVIKDSVYVIGLGPKPHLYHTFFITVDSSEFADMMNRYDEDIRIRAYLTLFAPSGKLEANQPVQFYIAAGSSACIANKGFTVKGEDGSPIFGKKNIKTSVFTGNENILIDEKKIKLRSGNGGQFMSYGIHETVQRILDYPSLALGGVKNNVGIIYINGSFWSLTFPQRKSDDERDLAAKWNTHKDSIDVGSPIPFNIYVDTFYAGCKTFTFPLDSLRNNDFPQVSLRQMSDVFASFKKGNKTFAEKFAQDLKKVNVHPTSNARLSGDTTITVCGTFIVLDFSYDSLSETFYNMLGFDTVQFFPDGFFEMDKVVMVHNPDGQMKIITALDEGVAARVQPIVQRLNEMLFDSTDHYDELASLIDLDNVLRYLVAINYFGIHDAISNNTVFTLSNKTKLSVAGTDFDDAQVYNYYTDNWLTKILNDPSSSYGQGFFPQVVRMILRSPKAQERLILLYEDMLNTVFKSDRTVPIVETMRNLIMPEYPYNFQAWGGSPNGGTMTEIVDSMFSQTKRFVSVRNDIALQILTNQFRPTDSLVVSNDAHMVHIVFDSIVANIAEVVVNNDTLLHIQSNSSGKFLVKPAITIEIRSINGFEIKVKEFPDSGSVFKLHPDSVTTLTLVIRSLILPVELVTFGCALDSEQVVLSWSTASELNNSGFVVERSSDGSGFDSIGYVVGAGSSSHMLEYSFTDIAELHGDVYYRIKQVDNNGYYVYSDVCMVKIKDIPTNVPEIVIYPNPGEGTFHVKNTTSVQKITVYDAMTRLVYENDAVFTEIPLVILSKGTYVVLFTMKNGEQITKKVALF